MRPWSISAIGASPAPGVPAGGSIISYARGDTTDDDDDDDDTDDGVEVDNLLCVHTQASSLSLRAWCIKEYRTKRVMGIGIIDGVVVSTNTDTEARVRPRLHAAAAAEATVAIVKNYLDASFEMRWS